MSVEAKILFDEDAEYHIHLRTINANTGHFPGKIIATPILVNDISVVYIPKILANRIIVLTDEDTVVGHCYCSECKKPINLSDKYCTHCGSKFRHQNILGEDNA